MISYGTISYRVVMLPDGTGKFQALKLKSKKYILPVRY